MNKQNSDELERKLEKRLKAREKKKKKRMKVSGGSVKRLAKILIAK